MKKRTGTRVGDPMGEIYPDEIFLDSKNLPSFDVHQFEGRIEKPISKNVIKIFAIFCALLIWSYAVRVFYLEIVKGEQYFSRSEKNHLRYSAIFSDRGIIADRNDKALVQNEFSTTTDFSSRNYTDMKGFSHILGYVKYPSRDTSGFYYKVETEGVDGVEKRFNDLLKGTNGVRIIEVNARGEIESRSVISPPKNGEKINLSIDSRLQENLYRFIRETASESHFDAGAGVMMDVRNGEVLALASYPEFSSQILTDGSNINAINNFLKDDRKPFLNRAISGLYTPGSIVKPFVALGALKEGVITDKKEIISTGSISIQNPYDPTKKSVFKDWKAHGAVDMRRALAVSSDVYFYEIGGGFENQKGLGIERLEKYFRIFGFGSEVNDQFFGTKEGTIPNPEWKKENFKGEDWRIGDTYNTSIGQYGMQVTPIQAVRAVASIANGGLLLTPTIIKGETREKDKERLDFTPQQLTVVKEGMREGVLLGGTAHGLDIPQVKVAAKTGTAELGVSKLFVNSWVIGFFPYENPRYAFAVIMEKGSRDNLIGALYVERQFLEWMSQNTPEYLE